jgi:hypothetical protein
LKNASYLFQNTTEHSQGCGQDYHVSAAARKLYQLTREQARFSEWVSHLTGRAPGHPRPLSAVTASRDVTNRRYAGLQTVALSQITGSVDRVDDFDAALRPRDDRTQQRWLRVATARSEGQTLPPVELIRIGESYYIEDGHHRVSVALARGEDEIEAEVTEWQLE